MNDARIGWRSVSYGVLISTLTGLTVLPGGGAAFAARADGGQENPDLIAACGTDVIVVLDESASIASPVDFTGEVRAAVLNFTDGLMGTGTRMRLVEFSTNARDVSLSGGTGFQTVDSSFKTQLSAYLNGTGLPQDGTSYHPSTADGAQIHTNWEAALNEAAKPGSPATGGVGAPLVVFLTDGDSNTDGTSGNSVGANLGNNEAGYQAGADAAIAEMAALQAAGSHVLSIAVGAASQQQASYNRLTGLTEPGTFQEWSGTAGFRAATTDALRVTFFDGLRHALSGVLNSLCRASLTIRKTDTGGNVIASRGFDVTVSSAPTGRPMEWVTPSSSPTTATTPSTRSASTASNGQAEFVWVPGSANAPQNWTSLVKLSETLPPDWAAGDASCVLNGNTASPVVLEPTVVGSVATWGGAGLAMGSADYAICTVVNKRPTQITIKKSASPSDGTDFAFTTTSTGSTRPLPASFSLDVDSDPTLPSSQTFTVSAGTYTITEAMAAAGSPWRLVKLSCKMPAQSPGSSAKTNLATRTATLVLFDGDQVTCTYTNSTAAPYQIGVAKTASPTTIQEPSGTVTYGVTISNPGTERLTVASIHDLVQLREGTPVDLDLALDSPGGIDAAGGWVTANTCDDVIAKPTVVDSGKSVTCSFTMTFTGRNAGQAIDDTVTAVGRADTGTTVSGQSSASVTVVGQLPLMIVDKQNVQTSIIAPGGIADYQLVIINAASSIEPFTIRALTDQMFVDKVGGTAVFDPWGPPLNIVTGGGPVTATTCGALIGQVLTPGTSAACKLTINTTAIGDLAAGDLLRNQIVATSTDDEGTPITGQDIADRPVLLTAVLLDVWKTDGRATVIEPGSQVTYQVRVDNRGIVGANPWLRIERIVDDVHFRMSNTDPIGPSVGKVTIDANGVNAAFTRDDIALVDTTCGALIGLVLQPTTGLEMFPGFGQDGPRLRPVNPEARSECTITLALPGDAGNQFDDTVAVETVDPGEVVVRGTNGANTPVIGVPPGLALVKTASPTSVVEPGGPVTFTFQVTNTSVASDPVTITRLSDSVFGDLLAPGRTDTDCAAVMTNAVLQPGAALSCSLTYVVAGNAGQNHANTAVVTGVDDEGNSTTATDDEVVTIVDAPPTITVTKTAIAPEPLPVTVSELGEDVTFEVDVVNTSPEPLTLVSLVDNVFGDLDGHGTCAVGETIEVGGTYSCTFTGLVRQLGSEAAHVNVVTVHVHDDENNDGTASDDETIPFERIAPQVAITKSDGGAVLPEPGGPVRFEITFTNPVAAIEDLTKVASLTDTIRYRDRPVPVVVDLLAPPSPELVDNTCPAVIAAALPIIPGEGVTCAFTVLLAGTSQTVTDSVTIWATDNDGEVAKATSDENTPLTDVPPAVTIVKSADPTIFPDGQATTYSFTITNGTAAEPFFVVGLVDDKFGDLTERCWGTNPPVLAPLGQPGDSVTCLLRMTPLFEAGSHHNVATVSGGDDEILDRRRNPGEEPPPALVTASDDETVHVGLTPEIRVQFSSICVHDAPYIAYDIIPVGFTPVTTPTLTFYDLDGALVRTLPVDGMSGRVLYPGATVDANGVATDWPGWKPANGGWVTDATDARWRDGLRIVVKVNPTTEGTVSYPAATSACAGPKWPQPSPGRLPETGAGGISVTLPAAAWLTGAGLSLLLLRRRRRPRLSIR